MLLACALAPADELGFFAASDVREPLSSVMNRKYEIPAFARHLDRLASPERGFILEKSGVPHNYRFRFANPLFQPFVLMKGVGDGLVEPAALERLARGRRNGRRGRHIPDGTAQLRR